MEWILRSCLCACLLILSAAAANAAPAKVTGAMRCPILAADSYNWGLDDIPGSGRTIGLAQASSRANCKKYNREQTNLVKQIIKDFRCPEECPIKTSNLTGSTQCVETTTKVVCDMSVQGQEKMIMYCRESGFFDLIYDARKCIQWICESGDFFTFDVAAGSLDFSVTCN